MLFRIHLLGVHLKFMTPSKISYHRSGGKEILNPSFSGPKIKFLKLRSSGARSSSGTHITHPYCWVPGADGTIARGRRARARVLLRITVLNKGGDRDIELEGPLPWSEFLRVEGGVRAVPQNRPAKKEKNITFIRSRRKVENGSKRIMIIVLL